jgi:hypothetical protein
MNWSYREPTLDELLSDSLIKLVMKADGVDADELEASCIAWPTAGRRKGRSLISPAIAGFATTSQGLRAEHPIRRVGNGVPRRAHAKPHAPAGRVGTPTLRAPSTAAVEA